VRRLEQCTRRFASTRPASGHLPLFPIYIGIGRCRRMRKKFLAKN
jgi:hypothetical protein